MDRELASQERSCVGTLGQQVDRSQPGREKWQAHNSCGDGFDETQQEDQSRPLWGARVTEWSQKLEALEGLVA